MTQHNESVLWRQRSSFGIGLLMFFIAISYWACVIGDLPKEGLRCFNGDCLPGYRCNENQKCVKESAGEKAPPQERGAPEEKPTATDKQKEAVDSKEEPGPQDAGGPEEKVVTEPPPTDQPTGPQCPFRTATKPELCPIPQGDTNSCEQLTKTFRESTEGLPEAVTDMAAISNGADWNLLFQSSPKVFLHIFGGRVNGKASKKVYLATVDSSGNLGKWTPTSDLETARYGASAFAIKGYVYIVGGMADGDQPVSSMERAKIKADGTLEPFQKFAEWPGGKAQEGLAYHRGYFYRAGGLDGGKLVTTVSRVLLQPSGKTLGTPEPLPDLPEGRTGPMVSTANHLYMLGPNGSRKVLMAQFLSNGKFDGWCTNTPLPKDAKSFTALTDARRILLLGVQKNNDQLEKNIYLSPLFSSADPLANPYGGGVDNWRCSRSDKLDAKFVTPRYRSTAVVALNFVFVLGGLDGTGKALKSVEVAELAYRAAGCDLDRDIVPNNFDFCPNTYATGNKNSDQPATVKRPGSTGYVEAFGPGDACEFKNMQLVPSGLFTRGQDKQSDEPIKNINLRGFYIDPKEVTNQDYAECVKQGKCSPPKDSASATRSSYYGDDKYKNFPVINVTWEQAKAYCLFRGKRLPSEAEWEKSARGLDRKTYPWGDSTPTCEQAQSKACTEKDTLEAGTRTKGQSPYGALDMAGNVREWVADYYKDAYYKDSPDENPKGPNKGTERVIRGGSFKSESSMLRVSARDKAKPTEFANDLGFRCAQSILLPVSASD